MAPDSSPAVHLGSGVPSRAVGIFLSMIVLAHRGLPSQHCPENTVAAVHAAFASGADGVEVDLRLTFDGVLAVSHDADLARVTGSPTAVATSRWGELHDAAAARGVVLACAEDVLVAAAGRRVVLEVKQPPPGPAATARTALAVLGQVRSLRRQGLPMDVTVSSFSPAVAEHVRRLLPPGSGVRTALLGRPLHRPTALLRQALDNGHDEIHPHVVALLADAGTVAAAHGLGVAVVPWTVNRRRDVQRFARLGVDAVITDLPASVRATLTETTAVA